MARREQIAQSKQTVAIIGGTGALGFGLAVRWAMADVPIVIGSRDPERATEAAERVVERAGGGRVSGLQNEEAAARASTVLMSVPFRVQAENLNNLRYALQPQTTLIDATVPLAAAVGGKATRMVGIWQGSAAQATQELVPEGVRVVSALHTISATILADLDHPLEQDVLVCGDKRADKREAAQLIERIDGLRCVDCGKLENSRTTESLTALLIGVNVRYKVHAGVRLSGLPDALWE